MKRLLTVFFIGLFFISCGTTKQADQEETQLSAEEETALADSLSNQIENARTELEQSSQENLAEIDSLLENF